MGAPFSSLLLLLFTWCPLIALQRHHLVSTNWRRRHGGLLRCCSPTANLLRYRMPPANSKCLFVSRFWTDTCGRVRRGDVTTHDFKSPSEWCGRRDSNPQATEWRQVLSLLRLPFRHSRQQHRQQSATQSATSNSSFHGLVLSVPLEQVGCLLQLLRREVSIPHGDADRLVAEPVLHHLE